MWRREKTVSGPFDIWCSGPGGGPCKVPQLTASGCYVTRTTQHFAGDPLSVSVTTPDGATFLLSGVVESVDRGIGFSVRFIDLPSPDRLALRTWIASSSETPQLGIEQPTSAPSRSTPVAEPAYS